MNTSATISFDQASPCYDVVSRSLHWIILVLLSMQFALGWLMPDADSMKTPTGLTAWHVGIGTSVLAIVAVRLVWALLRHAPRRVKQAPLLQFLATATHALIYALLLLVPILGWLNANGRDWIVKLAGVWRIPAIATSDSLGAAIGEWHSASATALLLLIGLHVIAVLVHQFGFKDGLLRRML